MKLLKNTINGYRYLHWNFRVAFAYFMMDLARKLHIVPKFFFQWHENVALKDMKRNYDANPNYKVVHLSHKLFAAVVNK
jgi:hypothetical protein